jgi:predicted TIM-barrel fold metal-dependent hydrolase
MSPEPVGQPLVDCDVHAPTPTIAELRPCLSDHWSEYVEVAGFTGSMAATSTYPPRSPVSGTAYADGADPVETLRRACLGDEPRTRAVLSTHYGVEAMGPPDFASELSRAINDWLIDRWLSADERLLGSVVVPPQYPDLAAAEIDRVGDHPRMAQVFLPARAVHPYGNHNYDPIFDAAERHGLVIGLHFGGMTWTPPTPVGWSSYYIEEYVGAAHIMQAQLASLVIEGTFQRHPGLRVAVLEGGWTWLPNLMWRLDKEWKGIRRETPWLTEPPSAYLRRHVRMGLQPVDAPIDGDQVLTVIDQIGAEEMLMFSSDFPHEHGSDPHALLARLPGELAAKVRYANAVACYGLAGLEERRTTSSAT